MTTPTGRINVMLYSAIGALLHLKTAGTVKDVVIADEDFAEFIQGRGGRFDCPILGVAYAGGAGEPMETGGLHHSIDSNVVVIAVVHDRSGVAFELAGSAGLNALTDAIYDALAGKLPALYDDAGALVLDGDGAVQYKGDAWAYRRDAALPLRNETKHNLRAWSSAFSSSNVWTPDRADVTAQQEVFDGIDGEMDPRPGETPETPAADETEFEIDFSEE